MSYQVVPTSDDERDTQPSPKSPSVPQSRFRTHTLLVLTALALVFLGFQLRKWSSSKVAPNTDQSVKEPVDHSVGGLAEAPEAEMSPHGKLNVA